MVGLDVALGLQPAPRRIGVGDALAPGTHLAIGLAALRAEPARAERVREQHDEAFADQEIGPFAVELRLGRRAVDEPAAIVHRHHGRERSVALGPVQRAVQRHIVGGDVDVLRRGGSSSGAEGHTGKCEKQFAKAHIRQCKFAAAADGHGWHRITARAAGAACRRSKVRGFRLGARNDYVAPAAGHSSEFGAGPKLCRRAVTLRKQSEAHLLNRTDRPAPMPGEADVKYLDGDFRVVRPGAFVRCAVTGVAIPLEELRYWSVDLQEAYATPEAVAQRQALGVSKQEVAPADQLRFAALSTNCRNSSCSSMTSRTGKMLACAASAASDGSPARRT